MFHTVAAGASLGAGPNLDTAFAADGVLGVRNSHLLLTDPFVLLAAAPIGALITRQRFNNAQLIQKGIPHLWPLIVSATIPNNPLVADMRYAPMALPVNEEIIIESSNSAAGPTDTNSILWTAPPDWSMDYPPFSDRLSVRCTAVVTAAANEFTWTALAVLVFERDLLNGVYAVIGCNVVAANAVAFRLRFPDAVPYAGKQLRPGGLVQNTAATQPWPAQAGGFGEWGRFHTFTLPEIQVFGDAAGGTYEIRLDLLYLGQSRDLLGVR